jgi:hypothetical protein
MASSYHNLPMPVRRASAGKPAVQADTHAVVSPQQQRDQRVFMLGGMLLVVVVVVFWQAVVTPWWQSVTDQWQYGTSKTFQMDAVVGHEDSQANPTHFLAFILRGRITVIEFPGGSMEHARVYTSAILIGEGSSSRVVTLQVTGGKQAGKPDLIIHIEGISATPLLYNSGSAFSWTQ